MNVFKSATLLAAVMAPAGLASAQGLHAVHPLAGYTCAQVNLSAEQLRDFSALPPIFQSPSANAPRTGTAGATVIVVSPPRIVNGLQQILQLDGQLGWTAADKLKPWSNPMFPHGACIPSQMSNGHPGFAYRR
jgi:hypothetical protein